MHGETKENALFRYIKGTVTTSLKFGKNVGEVCDTEMVSFVDSDFEGDLDKRRSSIGYIFSVF